MDGWDTNDLIGAALLAIIAVIALERLHRFLRRIFRRRRPVPSWARGKHYYRRRHPTGARIQSRPPIQPAAPFERRRFWVVDGDTIRDNATKTVYRLENIDCPETNDLANCYRERTMGERAKLEAIRLLKGATAITVRPTGKIDQHGRSIALIDVDGRDFGQLMIARGFARPWRGVREDWCGPNGGLARMAETCSAKFHCKTCGGRAGFVEKQRL